MPARERRTTDAEVRARALGSPGIRALFGHRQPVARAPGEADSLRSRFWGELVADRRRSELALRMRAPQPSVRHQYRERSDRVAVLRGPISVLRWPE